ncbi:uncharacterized protein VTP21DRAFT_5273 [Calcarisporiella thermophila]|uniref:uncharacterized protein n=1 Tax=Calcarisporiella thermophila TaxID=911321 RepID=UPI003742FBF0
MLEPSPPSLSKSALKRRAKLEYRKHQAYSCVSRSLGLPTHENLFSPDPTPCLLLASGSTGQGGVTCEQVERLFSGCEGFERVFLGPCKPYTLVYFRDAACAVAARSRFHEQLWENANTSKPIFLEYLPRHSVDMLLAPHPSAASPENHLQVPGLTLYQDFLSPEEEALLLDELEKNEWRSVQERMVQQYGHAYDYTHFAISTTSPPPIPSYIIPLMDRIHTLRTDLHPLTQLAVQKYEPGQGIPPHADSHVVFSSAVVCISLAAPITMDFIKGRDPLSETGGHVVSVDVPARSLMILEGEARYGWEHCIRERTTDFVEGRGVRPRRVRVSMTFRALRAVQPCECPWPEICDRDAVRFGFPRRAS